MAHAFDNNAARCLVPEYLAIRNLRIHDWQFPSVIRYRALPKPGIIRIAKQKGRPDNPSGLI
ncbi:hypothetical protein D3C80_600150 [compost metagenome]